MSPRITQRDQTGSRQLIAHHFAIPPHSYAAKQPTVAFWGTVNAPQGNYKESAHCIFVDGHVELILNKRLKDNQCLNHYRLRKPPQ